MNKNEVYTAEITGYTHEGDGVCRIENMVVFVKYGVVFDICELLILKVSKGLAYAKISKLITPSPYRDTVDCPVFYKCGGCDFRHIKYSEELRLKGELVLSNIKKIGKTDCILNEIIASDNTNCYRNKAQFPVRQGKDTVVSGFFRAKSHDIVELDNCLLQSTNANKIKKAVLSYMQKSGETAYDEQTNTGVVRHIYVREASFKSGVMVVLVINADDVKNRELLISELLSACPEVSTILLNKNCEKTNVILGKKQKCIYGDGYITDKLLGLLFKISPLSFYQVNAHQAEKLYKKAIEYANLSQNDIVFDIFCGTGTIGLCMAQNAKKVVGIELVADAVADACENARLNNIKNAEFICGDAYVEAKKLVEAGILPDVVVIDPPRKGAGDALVSFIASLAPKRVVYVSCDSATLARDIAYFKEHGYTLKLLSAVDMFPKTANIECVALIERPGDWV